MTAAGMTFTIHGLTPSDCSVYESGRVGRRPGALFRLMSADTPPAMAIRPYVGPHPQCVRGGADHDSFGGGGVAVRKTKLGMIAGSPVEANSLIG